MDIDFSQIRELLSQESSASLHRNVFILAGDDEWQKYSLQKILSDYESEALWVSEHQHKKYPFIETKKSLSWLGNENRVVIFDANEDFDPDSFAAISGIVVGGGLFFLLLPAKEKWDDIYLSYFGQRLLQSIQINSDLTVIHQTDSNINFILPALEDKPATKISFPYITEDQKYSVESIEEHLNNNTNTPIVLISDRGRGKSAALGIAIAKSMKSGIKNIAITAPRLTATNVVFKHIAELLPDAEISKGYVKYADSVIQFYSPDNLIRDEINADVLFVDESAAIPIPLLTSFLSSYPQCVFATTVHGYEGTGRGFSLRFFKVLDKFNSNWIKLQMQTPIRWEENDPLEKWMFDLLCLDAEIANEKVVSEIDFNKVEYLYISKKVLFENNVLLKEVFSLLVLAHYRTRPRDLKSLLDDENISLYVALYNEHAIAVSLVISEGSFSSVLSTEVYRGERRPQGHLLAQALTYHCGVENAATLDYARIMRIAVHPELQGNGIGSKLLNFIIEQTKENGCDVIGTSFGMNEKLLSFWTRASFNMARIGFTREQTSGEHAAIMMLALSSGGKGVNQEVNARFEQQIPFLFDDVLKDIPDKIKNLLNVEASNEVELNLYHQGDLKSFIKFSRNYEICIASINKLFVLKYNCVQKDNFPDDFRTILTKKIINKESWNEITSSMKIKGKTAARNVFYNAIIHLIELE